MPFEKKNYGITSFFALYLDKNIAPVHAFFISFLSLKRYYSIILFIILCAWSQGIERGNVSTVICACESRLGHALAQCVNLYQSISKGCIPVSQKTDQESLCHVSTDRQSQGVGVKGYGSSSINTHQDRTYQQGGGWIPHPPCTASWGRYTAYRRPPRHMPVPEFGHRGRTV